MPFIQGFQGSLQIIKPLTQQPEVRDWKGLGLKTLSQRYNSIERINGFLLDTSNTVKWIGVGGRIPSLPLCLTPSLWQTLTCNIKKNWKVTNGGVHNLTMSSDITHIWGNVSRYNPGIYKNWHFNPPAESTDTRKINSTHLWLPNGKPKAFQNENTALHK